MPAIASLIEQPRTTTLSRGSVALGVMIASGFAGLGLQIVWTQQCALWLGSEAAAMLAVVAAFFGGLAFGASVLGSRIERSSWPARWYAACELAIGGWSIALIWLMPACATMVLHVTGAEPSPTWQWMVAFTATFLLLLPATAAMGATLPAMERTLSALNAPRAPSDRGASIATLYAANTAGAVVGVIATAFWLMPTFGLTRTASVCIVLNLSCAVVAWRGFTASVDSSVAPTLKSSGRMPWVLAATGLLGIGYEVLVVRVVSQVAENTVYTFAILLAVYLIGTASGAALYRRCLSRIHGLRDRLLIAVAIACLVGTASLWQADAVKAGLIGLSPSITTALLAEAAVCVLAFLMPTVAMGALFSHLATQARAEGIGFGRALAFNTLGAAAAPLVFGVIAVPAIGPKQALLFIAAAYLLLASRHAWRRPWLGVSIGAIAALAVWAPPLAFIDVPDGGRVVSYRDGATAAVSVVEDAQGVSRLRIDNRQQEGSSASRFADGRQALLPLLLHPAPHRALFLGLGTGVTSLAAAADASLQVDVVELLPEVIEASLHFADPYARRPHVIAADARRFVRAATAQYDVVVSDNFHPARNGSAALYTVEHFRAVRDRLSAGGVFCQWLPLHQLDLQTLRSIVAAFMAAYPDGAMILATNSLETPTIGLIGHADGERFDMAAVQARIANAAWPLADFALDDRFAVMGSFVAGPVALNRFAANAPLNTDDCPIVAWLAPRITYAPDSQPRDRLLALLNDMSIGAPERIDANPEDARRLAAYWQARNRFIEAGRRVEPSSDVRVMLAQVREPLLAVLRISPDFTPAFEPLRRMAMAWSAVDPAGSRTLLGELDRVRPTARYP